MIQLRAISNRLPRLSIPHPQVWTDPQAIFCHLTGWTVPYGNEERHYGDLLHALGFQQDDNGNWWQEVGTSRTAFMAHLDTACGMAEPIRRQKEGAWIRTDGRTILGADDRAGLTVLLYLLHSQVPGYYALFVGEEAGCIGSRAAAKSDARYDTIDRAICFDRKGTSSIITHQCGARTASDTFAEALAEALNAHGLAYAPDDGGVFTDSDSLMQRVSECTNVSIGYEGAHTNAEKQDMRHLAAVCRAAVRIDWEALPTVRDVKAPVDDAYGDWLDGRWARTTEEADLDLWEAELMARWEAAETEAEEEEIMAEWELLEEAQEKAWAKTERLHEVDDDLFWARYR